MMQIYQFLQVKFQHVILFLSKFHLSGQILRMYVNVNVNVKHNVKHLWMPLEEFNVLLAFKEISRKMWENTQTTGTKYFLLTELLSDAIISNFEGTISWQRNTCDTAVSVA